MVFNPSTIDRLCHVLLACWLTGSFFVISVAAYYLLKQRHKEIANAMMSIGLTFAMLSLVLQLISGDSSARLVARYQPAKLAAFEGLYETTAPTPISVVGWVDAKNEKVHSIKIPGALSLMTYRDLSTPVTGLDKIPRNEWPNVSLVFQTYHIMVTMWGLMFLIALFGIYHWGRNTLHKKRWLLWSMVFSVLLPHIAQQCGWIAAEVGRQPWIVWKVLRTSEGVSKTIAASQVFGSITMFLCIYILLFSLFIFLLDRKIKHGPEEVRSRHDDAIYRNLRF
jgi:cytochrome d ubiquinol oxidase subunit I